MATQFESEIPFSISSSQQHFRLLELPTELLEVLSGPSPPRLQFKSSDPSLGPSEIALCTPNKTYQLRQVQISNSVLIVQPTTSQGPEPDSIPQPALTAISQCSSTLETLPLPTTSAIALLKQALPLYTEDTNINEATPGRTKDEIFSDIPLSEAECQHAWKELQAFELQDKRSCFRPTASLRLEAWRRMYNAAVGRNTDIPLEGFATDLMTLLDATRDWPEELELAVLQVLVHPSDVDLFADDAGHERVQFDRAKTLWWTGTTLLESQSPMAQDEFMDQWQELLPERWAKESSLELLKGSFTVSTKEDKIEFVSRLDDNASQPAAAPAKVPAKRKWHEKFAQARKR